jgi:hypothetical protein
MNATLMSGSSTGDKRAMNILRELHAAEEELVGRAVVLTDGKAGTIDHVFLDDVHGLRISIRGHEGRWPISTVKHIEADRPRELTDRIQARAVRRCQELLKQFPEGDGRPKKNLAGADEVSTRRQVAHGAGMSDRQYRTAMAVGNIPEEQFEAAVESDVPPTVVTALAEMGKQVRAVAPMSIIFTSRLEPPR